MGDMAHGQQQSGTRSTFGPQPLSNRASSPTIKFGSGGRTTKTWDKSWESLLLGRTSPGATTLVRSGIGCQAESRCKSAPSHKIPKAALHDKPNSPNICPGTYQIPTGTLGLQLVESQRPRSAAYKLGTSPRWCEFKAGCSGGPAQPMLVNSKLPVGYLGDAPKWSFHGPQQRRPLTAGSSQNLSCPLAPTSASSPGPGAYATASSAFGRQVSRACSSTGIKFGSSDRFSDTKPALKKTASSNGGSSTSGGSSSGSATSRSHSGAGQRPGTAGQAVAAAAWPFSSPGPGAYFV